MKGPDGALGALIWVVFCKPSDDSERNLGDFPLGSIKYVARILRFHYFKALWQAILSDMSVTILHYF